MPTIEQTIKALEKELRSEITSLWTEVDALLADVGEGAEMAPTPPVLNVSRLDGTNTARANLKSRIALIGWPRNGRRDAKRLHIFVDGGCDIDLNTKEMIKYRVEVCYCELVDPETNELRPLHTIHYDMQSRHQVGHPWFHAQFGEAPSEAALCAAGHGGQSYTLSAGGDRSHVVGNIRIPTPQCDLASVIVNVVADHFLARDPPNDLITAFEKLIQTVEKNRGCASPSIPHLIDGISQRRSIASSLWYCNAAAQPEPIAAPPRRSAAAPPRR